MTSSWITVIIAVKNGEKTLSQCLDSVLANAYGQRDIIVVDDGSTDRTGHILKQYQGRVSVITNATSTGPALARTMAAASARGEYLAFTDADCIVAKDWLSELLSCFQDAAIVSAGGRQDIPDDESSFGREVSVFMQAVGFATDYIHPADTGIRQVRHNASCNVMYRKDVFLSAGGFPRSVWPGEDVDLDHRLTLAGHKLVYNPCAVVCHYRPSTMKAFDRMMWRYGCAQAVLALKYGFFRPVQYVPIITCILLAGTGIVFIWNVLAGIVTVVGILVFTFAYFLVVTKSVTRGCAMPVFLVHALVSWNIGFMKGLVTRSTNQS